MHWSRRRFLETAGAVALAAAGLRCGGESETPAPAEAPRFEPFGPLVGDPSGILDLPRGFRYDVISRTGDLMSDGLYVPAQPGGMGAVAGPGGSVVVARNHALSVAHDADAGPFGPGNHMLPRFRALYDPGRDAGPPLGGVTALVYHPARRRLESQRLVLSGLVRPGSGTITPWGSWLACEEAVVRAGGHPTTDRDHGYCFEVPLEPGRRPTALPLAGMGRFYREAAAVDPGSGIVYQSEDLPDGLLYRFVPAAPGRLAQGGRLQALALRDRPSADTSNRGEGRVEPGGRLPVAWIDLEGADSPDDDLRLRGFRAGAARFSGGGGMAWLDGSVYLACASGGPIRRGQVWRHAPGGEREDGTGEDGGVLELVAEAGEADPLRNPGHAAPTPWGDLLLCEDGPRADRLVGMTPEGRLYVFAQNRVSLGQLAGACFSPDGSVLFLNLPEDGMTLAVTGPWDRRAGLPPPPRPSTAPSAARSP